MILLGDCIERMAEMDEASVDAIVTDPPYGLEFMGKEWDSLRSIAGRDALKPSDDHRFAKGMKLTGSGNPTDRIASPNYAPKKNPRCRRCSRLKFDHAPRKCQCERPDWDTRTAEYARTMQQWHQAWATEALRVLKPGGHLLAFGGTRTYHRLACAIEDAGFEVRDSVIWLYGSGFPKSHNLNGDWQGWGTALKPAHEPIVVARKPLIGTVAQNVSEHGTGAINVDACRIGLGDDENRDKLEARSGGERGFRTDGYVAGEHDGGLPPGWDASKGRWPANCALSHLPECERVGTREGKPAYVQPRATTDENGASWGKGEHVPFHYDGSTEVWNCVDGCSVAELDRQSGTLTTNPGTMRNESVLGGYHGTSTRKPGTVLSEGDTGGASRFFATFQEDECETNMNANDANDRARFGDQEGGASVGLADTNSGEARFRYVAKASRAERNAGLDGFAEQALPMGGHGNAEEDPISEALGSKRQARNNHPTVKPIDLMRWLVRLVTPPGGIVLDPFTGSGTTGIAATLEGFSFIGIEREAEYAEIARARLAWWAEHPEGMELVKRLNAEAERKAVADNGQLELL